MKKEQTTNSKIQTIHYDYLILVGPSGSGKTYIKNKLLEDYPKKFYNLTQYTTRARRKDESLNSYKFITEKEFLKLKPELIGVTKFYNIASYGTKLTYEENKTGIVVLAMDAILDFVTKISEPNNIITTKQKNLNILILSLSTNIDKNDISLALSENNRHDRINTIEKEITDTNVYNIYSNIIKILTATAIDFSTVTKKVFLDEDTMENMQHRNIDLYKTCIFNNGTKFKNIKNITNNWLLNQFVFLNTKKYLNDNSNDVYNFVSILRNNPDYIKFIQYLYNDLTIDTTSKYTILPYSSKLNLLPQTLLNVKNKIKIIDVPLLPTDTYTNIDFIKDLLLYTV